MERLQQYNFEISHQLVKGQSHGNAEVFRCRPCAEEECRYCLRVEKQVVQKEDSQVARIVLQENLSQEWQKLQLGDEIVSIFLRGKENSDFRGGRWQLEGLLLSCTGLVGML